MRFAFAVVAMAGIASLGAFQPTRGVQDVSAQQAQSVWDGIYTEEQAKRGEPLYYNDCAVCHGPGGKSAGFTPGLDKLTKEVIADKLRKFRSGEKPSTIMHRFAKGFSDAQIDAIAAQLGK